MGRMHERIRLLRPRTSFPAHKLAGRLNAGMASCSPSAAQRVQKSACEALAYLVVGRRVEEVVSDLGAFARGLTGDSQLRWLGPEKDVHPYGHWRSD